MEEERIRNEIMKEVECTIKEKMMEELEDDVREELENKIKEKMRKKVKDGNSDWAKSIKKELTEEMVNNL